MAQITSVTSEALQSTIRRLLPAQQGFGEDLQASNVITPIIDLTPTAEGSSIPVDMQTALAFGSNTSFTVTNSLNLVTNTPGFFRVIGTGSVYTVSSVVRQVRFLISDGVSNNVIWNYQLDAASGDNFGSVSFDFVVFLRAGDTLNAQSTATDCVITGSSRQIADVNGNLVNPSGFTPS